MMSYTVCRKRKQRKKKWVRWRYKQIWWEEGRGNKGKKICSSSTCSSSSSLLPELGQGMVRMADNTFLEYPPCQLLQQFGRLETMTFDPLWRCRVSVILYRIDFVVEALLAQSVVSNCWQQQLIGVVKYIHKHTLCVFKIFFDTLFLAGTHFVEQYICHDQ